MNAPSLVLAALVILPAIGLAAWAWMAMSSATEDLRHFSGFEGLHFDQ